MLPQLHDPSSPLAAVLQRSDIWIGDRLAGSRETLSSGHPALDAELPGGGWPRGALVDLLHARPGIGELALVLPALAALTAQDEWIVVQAAPQRIFAPAWQAAGVQLARLMIVEAVAGNSRLAGSDTLWAAEQILRAGSVSAALLWLPRGCSSAQLRRLQVAAEAGRTLAFLLQDESRHAAASPAPLRLRLEAQPDGLAVHLFKRRGAPLARPILLPLAKQLSPARRGEVMSNLPVAKPAPGVSGPATRLAAERISCLAPGFVPADASKLLSLAPAGCEVIDAHTGQVSIGQSAIDQHARGETPAPILAQQFPAPRPDEAKLHRALARPGFPQAAA